VAKSRLFAGIAGIILGLCSLGATAAKGLTYTYGEIGYTNIDSDDVDADGATARISFGATDYLHVKLEYSHFNDAEVTRRSASGKQDLDVDIDRFLAGLGGNYTVLEKAGVLDALDVFGTLSYYNAENSGDSNNSDRGYQVDGGIRALLTKKFELNAAVTYLDIDNFDGETGFGGGVVYRFYKRFSATGNIRHFSEEDTTEIFAGLRYNF
jgi:hypothetical protein